MTSPFFGTLTSPFFGTVEATVLILIIASSTL
jgi:hypothetical protein